MEIVSKTVSSFTYFPPSINVSHGGEVSIDFPESKDDACEVKKSTFLFYEDRDDAGNVIFFEGIDPVNAYLMHRSVNDQAMDTRPSAKALLCYFNFLSIYEMRWDEFPIRNYKKPTYLFKKYLLEMYDQDELAASTAKAYMSEVVRFYKFYLSRKYLENTPFQFDEITLSVNTGHDSIAASRKIVVQTTDLRLRLKSPKNIMPNHLRSLQAEEWDVVDRIVRVDRTGMVTSNGNLIDVKLAEEFSLIFLLMRYAGLRREEAVTFPASLVSHCSDKGYVEVYISPSLGMDIKYNKPRKIEMPVELMNVLDNYIVSERYQKRLSKFLSSNLHTKQPPLFINRNGEPFNTGSVNCRWGEIRQRARQKYKLSLDHKSHNLRATFATFRLQELISPPRASGLNPIPVPQALLHIQEIMGHENLSTTENYLSQIHGTDNAFSLVEQAIDFQFDRL